MFRFAIIAGWFINALGWSLAFATKWWVGLPVILLGIGLWMYQNIYVDRYFEK